MATLIIEYDDGVSIKDLLKAGVYSAVTYINIDDEFLKSVRVEK